MGDNFFFILWINNGMAKTLIVFKAKLGCFCSKKSITGKQLVLQADFLWYLLSLNYLCFSSNFCEFLCMVLIRICSLNNWSLNNIMNCDKKIPLNFLFWGILLICCEYRSKRTFKIFLLVNNFNISKNQSMFYKKKKKKLD